MMAELICPECGSICAEVKVRKNGWRSGVCRNPACPLNQDGIGLITQGEQVVAAMSFPTSGKRLQDLADFVEGKAPRETVSEDIGVLDGFTFCGECGSPMFHDGKQHYRHIQDLPQSRLRKLMKVKNFAEQVHGWLTTIAFACPDHGTQPDPFIWEMDKETFAGYVATRAGARRLWLLLKEMK
jgi:hypothetical protein